MGKWPECHENCFEVGKRGVWIFAGFTQFCQSKKWPTGKTHLLILSGCGAVVPWHDLSSWDNQTINLNWTKASKTTSCDLSHSCKKVTNTQHKQFISKRATSPGKCPSNHSKAFLCFLSVILLIIFNPFLPKGFPLTRKSFGVRQSKNLYKCQLALTGGKGLGLGRFS